MKYYYNHKPVDGTTTRANGPDGAVPSPSAAAGGAATVGGAATTMSPPLGPRALALLALLLMNLLSHPNHAGSQNPTTTIDQLYVVVLQLSSQCHDQTELISTLSAKLDCLVQQVDSLKVLAHEALQLCMAVHSQTIGLPVERMVEHMSQQLMLLQRSVDELRPHGRPHNYLNLGSAIPPPKPLGSRLFGGYGDIDQDQLYYGADFVNDVGDGRLLGKKHRLEENLHSRLPMTNSVLAPAPAIPPLLVGYPTVAMPHHTSHLAPAPSQLGDIAYPFQIPNHIAAEVYPTYNQGQRYGDLGLAANSYGAPQLPRPQLQPQLGPHMSSIHSHPSLGLALRGMQHPGMNSDGGDLDKKYDHQDIPKYRMERLLKLILDIWREYEYGLNDKPPLKQLELQYGTKWRNETELRTFLRRKKIYEAIEIGKQKGYTEDEIINDLEEHRSYNSNGLIKRYPLLWLVMNMPAKYTNDTQAANM